MKNGELIRSYRKRKKLTMKELAEKVGVSEQAISQYERSVRTPNVVTLLKISGILNLPLDSFSVDIPIIPTQDEIIKNSSLALDTQILTYIDDTDRVKVKMLCKIFESFNYELEIDKNIVLVIDKVTDSTYVKIPKNEFVNMSEIFFWGAQGLIDNLKYKYEIKK